MTWLEIRTWLATREPGNAGHGEHTHIWRKWFTTRQFRNRLIWQYGKPRARIILLGLDPSTESDRAAWLALGDPIGPGEAA